MGLNFLGSSCTKDTPDGPVGTGNPNKYRFEVLKFDRVNGWAVVILAYADCTNFGGKKVLVYDDADQAWEAVQGGCVDPHFLDEGVSPVARFEPTQRGLEMAQAFALRHG